MSREVYHTKLPYEEWFHRADLSGEGEPGDSPVNVPRARAYATPARYSALNGEDDVRVERLVYASDGLRIAGYQITPMHRNRKLPAIVYCRGGLHDTLKIIDLLVMAQWARRGYVVLATQYRGSGGSEGIDEDGGADVHDVLALLTLAQQAREVDANNLFLYGQSRGGMMVYEALAAGAPVRGAVVNSGVSNMANIGKRPDAALMEAMSREAIPDYEHEKSTGFVSRSAVHWASKINTPLLILHRTADWRVDPSQALRMAAALQAEGKSYDLIMFANGAHVELAGDQFQIDNIVVNFCDRHRGAAVPPGLERLRGSSLSRGER